MGKTLKGRTCWAEMKAAVRVGGREFSEIVISCERKRSGCLRQLTAPCRCVLEEALLDVFCIGVLGRHWHVRGCCWIVGGIGSANKNARPCLFNIRFEVFATAEIVVMTMNASHRRCRCTR